MPAAPTSPDSLDHEVQSLFESGMRASREGRLDAAIHAWRACLERRPDLARVRYLLGAECAQAGKYGEAVLQLSLALEHEPGFAVLRLQLGLLWLTLGAPSQAAQALQPLVTQPASETELDFANGLIALARGHRDDARRHLAAGLAKAADNAPLHRDMQRVLDTLEHGAQSAVPAHHGLAISAYTNTRH